MRASTIGALKTNKGQFTAANVKTSGADLAKLYSLSAPALGSERLPIQIVEFADFACPHSAEEATVFRRMALKYSDRVRFVFRFFPINDQYPSGPKAALAALCAGEQGQFWKMHDLLFQNYGQLDVDSLYKYANDLGLDAKRFDDCYNDSATKVQIQKDVADGIAVGAKGTPTFFINGEKIEGAIPEDIFEKIILSLLAQKKS